MSLQQHVHDTAPGVAGCIVASGFTLTGFLVDATPVLQALSLLLGCVAAAVTIAYYVVQLRKRK